MSNHFMDELFRKAGKEYRPGHNSTNSHSTLDTQNAHASSGGAKHKYGQLTDATQDTDAEGKPEGKPEGKKYEPPGTPRATKYVADTIGRELNRLRSAAEGSRNHELFKVGVRVLEMAYGGYADIADSYAAVEDAATCCGLLPDEIRKSLSSAARTAEASKWQLWLEDRKLPALNVPSGEDLALDGVEVPEKPADAAAAASGADGTPRRELRLIKANRRDIRRLKWLWKDMVPAGGLTLWAGHAGIGKSQGAAWLAAQASNGSLEGELYGEPADVLYVGTEDFWNETILPRLDAAGADFDRLYKIEAGIAKGEEFQGTGLYLDLHMGYLRDTIKESGARVIVLDALLDVMKVEDLNKQGITRQRVSEIQRMGQELSVAFIGVCHFKKDVSSGPALHMISGSAEFGQVVRSAVGFAENKATGDNVISQMKRNLVKKGAGNFNYRIADACVPSGDPEDEEMIDVGRFELLGTSELELEDILSAGKDEKNTKVHDCSEWIKNYLNMSDGSVIATEIEAKVESLGYSRSTINRAKKLANVESVRTEFGGPWRWQLPDKRS